MTARRSVSVGAMFIVERDRCAALRRLWSRAFAANQKRRQLCLTTLKSVVRRSFEDHFNGRNTGAAADVYAHDVVMHTPDGVTGRGGMNTLMQTYASAFPDFVLTIDDTVAEGDRVAIRYSFTGTHQGTIVGIPPTGKRVTVAGNIGIYKVIDGRIAEGYVSWDRYVLMEQLGLVPALGAGAQPA